MVMLRLKFLLILLIPIIFTGCSDDENKTENLDMLYRTIAYESLIDEEKASIFGDWQDAKVINGTFKSDVCDYEFFQDNQGRICFFPKDQNIELVDYQRLAAVIFNTVNDSLLGPIMVIIDPNSELAVGYAARL
jgi:hypothetical protein